MPLLGPRRHRCLLRAACRRWVKLRLSTKAIKSIEKRGLQNMAEEAGIDLWKLPFEDARPQRREWLAGGQGALRVGPRPVMHAQQGALTFHGGCRHG